ncbi:MAG TPA: hypothetical protein VL689_21840 [Paraburkholderia sp.]|jgi:hypothetical protein|nr:hypothetical protein [Paraburkholderia sp.]
MIPIRVFDVAALAASAAVFAVMPTPAHAEYRQPLVLDTQTGIHDGQRGMWLQNAPLGGPPMVHAQSPARPAELAPENPPVVIVEPTVQIPGASGSSKPSSVPSGTSGVRPGTRPAAPSVMQSGRQ